LIPIPRAYRVNSPNEGFRGVSDAATVHALSARPCTAGAQLRGESMKRTLIALVAVLAAAVIALPASAITDG
jgi:hypothetical protein